MMMHHRPALYGPGPGPGPSHWSSMRDIEPAFDDHHRHQLCPFDQYVEELNDDDDDFVEDLDAYSCDEFRMYEFKIRRCVRGRAHDWTECPFAHPGEKARRRDPRKYHYSGTACPDFRKGTCKRGDACDMAHGVFECWLHPARYRTQPCKDGTACRRRVCFFAHTPEQLRVLPQSPKTPLEHYDGSPMRRQRAALAVLGTSPPVSTTNCDHEVLASLRKLQIDKMKSMSPRRLVLSPRVGFCSLPNTPTRDVRAGFDEEECVERVESGRALRARLYERLSKETGIDVSDAPDVGWVSELVK